VAILGYGGAELKITSRFLDSVIGRIVGTKKIERTFGLEKGEIMSLV
jgi:hypothetical protein